MTAPDGVTGVLFDIDDTLVDTRTAFAVALDAVVDAYLPGLGAPERAEVLAMWRADTGRYYKAYIRGELTQTAQRHARAQQILDAFGGPTLDDAGLAAWDQVYLAAFADGWVAHPEAVEVVGQLREAGIAVGALTNATREMQVLKLERTGFSDLPLLLTVDDLGVGKPDPRVFLEAVRLLGTSPGETVYVGDELDTDAFGARDAGLRGVWLDRPGNRRGGPHIEDPELAAAEGIPVLASLDELPSLLGVAPRADAVTRVSPPTR
ncbi:HAD-superfamily hydrolase, subfamily IA, variant 1 [Beutenbergia cavernae DSM 12333]|uniref:HAD-superfamily hydrolase, subfamily IA, variant 1 n=1 Tax=Beutenbergia cavernae (strain ATCC BAA-8 / DSM 12333 / CCUG 43141 / JCM 11478 / NBRC 16432 / NCIMB 13614 / HKI 0122) TaxID=471853 RepID=C5C3C3_BEUC1|nr:HAD family hydrolase [Beutenbergia cavernae]ACQ79822.1 HAD-superfamily hydrolase, subfamily IA, variant 1 [Beutenbergia cavernae DSM 12333]